jgi:hypothetical protein
MRSRTAVRRSSRRQPSLKETTGERSRRSNPVSWAWLDLNQRPHPYQVSRAQRCADRRFPRSLATVRGEGMRSNSPPPDQRTDAMPWPPARYATNPSPTRRWGCRVGAAAPSGSVILTFVNSGDGRADRGDTWSPSQLPPAPDRPPPAAGGRAPRASRGWLACVCRWVPVSLQHRGEPGGPPAGMSSRRCGAGAAAAPAPAASGRESRVRDEHSGGR